MREEYVVEVIRKACEKNEIVWKLDAETGAYTAEINNEIAFVWEGGRGLIFMKLQDGSSSRTIAEPALMIRPNSPADKVRNYLRKKFFKNRQPDKFKKMSIDMQFILRHAQERIKT